MPLGKAPDGSGKLTSRVKCIEHELIGRGNVIPFGVGEPGKFGDLMVGYQLAPVLGGVADHSYFGGAGIALGLDSHEVGHRRLVEGDLEFLIDLAEQGLRV